MARAMIVMSVDQVKETLDSSADSGAARAPLILSSGSRYRREMITRLQVPVQADSPDIDESPMAGESPVELSIRLARQKAVHVAQRHPGSWVLGSDQVAMLGDQPVGKPGTLDRARDQLRAASGQTVRFLTAMYLTGPDDSHHAHLDTTTVRFRTLSDAAIEDYLNRESALDCAGSFKSEGLGISLTESIESEDPTALIGLPLIALARMLRQIGLLPV